MRFPGSGLVRRIRRGLRRRSLESFWTRKHAKYRARGVAPGESLSGGGSSDDETRAVRRALPGLLAELNVKTMVDVPCGDFAWMRQLELPVQRYIGADIVRPLAERLQAEFGNEQRSFMQLDLTRDALPACDLVLCRDCLIHLPFADVQRVIANVKRSGASYLLTTTYTEKKQHRDIERGSWNAINLQLAPFRFPEPLRLIHEQSTRFGAEYGDRSLALWRVSELP
jgi:hypothetical protein